MISSEALLVESDLMFLPRYLELDCQPNRIRLLLLDVRPSKVMLEALSTLQQITDDDQCRGIRVSWMRFIIQSHEPCVSHEILSKL